MQPTTRRAIVTIMLATALVGLAGCGGGGDSPAVPNQSGIVTGFVVLLDTGSGDVEGLAGAEVSIATQTATSDAEGYFVVNGVPAGQQLVTVTLPAPYVLLSSEPIYCDAVAGQITELPEPIIAVTEDVSVPSPPPLWGP